ncbi:hypothetical protein CRM22_010995 [Opisthorchis felineus]|uniref:Uncharacterized protein n=1 Tax=Opisthorchis felineus TaxID=147828 RepID=A0A4S2KK33_OPIFE|nr:hypothetical protein CRM22_010995 [Opisthorchis felineus]
MRSIILCLFYLTTWMQNISCSVPHLLDKCNSLKGDSIILQLTGVLFTSVESNGTQYYFSTCGLKPPTNDSSALVPSEGKVPVLLRKKSGLKQWESLAYVSVNETVGLITKGGRSYVTLPQGHSCTVLISLQCGLKVNMFVVVDEGRDPESASCCFRVLEVYHPSICSLVLRPSVWGIILGCAGILLVLYCVIGLLCQRAMRKRSWYDSIPHITLLDRVTAGFTNGLRRLRLRRSAHLRTQYIRVPPTPDTPAGRNGDLKSNEPASIVLPPPLVSDADPQDDLLLAL